MVTHNRVCSYTSCPIVFVHESFLYFQNKTEQNRTTSVSIIDIVIGHLFQTTAHLQEEKKKREALLNEWQPPRMDEESDIDSDDELSQEVDLRR